MKMEIDYDKDADALYLKLNEGKFNSNKVVDDFTILDLDSNGNVLGVEMLEVSKRLIDKSFNKVKF